MAKLIYLTEEQLNELSGGYIDPDNSIHGYDLSKTYITSPVSDEGDFGKEPTTDEISRDMVTPYPKGTTPYGMGLHRLSGEDGEELTESNKDLSGKQKTFQLSKNALDKIKQSLEQYEGPKNDAGIKRGKDMVADGNISYDMAYRALNDMKNGKAGHIFGPEIQSELERKIEMGKNRSKSSREFKKSMGQNVIKSAPKNGSKGGQHTSKFSSNVIGVEKI